MQEHTRNTQFVWLRIGKRLEFGASGVVGITAALIVFAIFALALTVV